MNQYQYPIEATSILLFVSYILNTKFTQVLTPNSPNYAISVNAMQYFILPPSKNKTVKETSWLFVGHCDDTNNFLIKKIKFVFLEFTTLFSWNIKAIILTLINVIQLLTNNVLCSCQESCNTGAAIKYIAYLIFSSSFNWS